MAHYLITGATGYVGSMVVKELYKRAEEDDTPVRVTAIVRNVQRAREILPGEVTLVDGDITDTTAYDMLEGSVDFLIHCAAATTSAYMISNPVETADGIVLGTRNMLELAKQLQVKSMVYLSSMEVYGRVSDIGRPRSEEELGDIGLNNFRSCYPLGKRMAEHYCHIYRKEYGVPVKIARLAQTFGVGVRPEDNRVYMQFARAAYEGRDIILKTQGGSLGNYCDIEDVVDAVLTILHKGSAGEVYNVVNEENTMSIKDMAQLVAAKIAGGSIAVRVEEEDIRKTGYAPETKLRMSGEKLRALGWKPTKDLVQMYRGVLETLRLSADGS